MSAGTGLNWAAQIELHAARTPQAPAVEFSGVVTSYADLALAVRTVSRALADLGVDRGDRVALLSYNSDVFLQLMVGSNHRGAVPLPINWRLSPHEVAYALDNSEARVLFVDAELVEVAIAAREQVDGPVAVVVIDTVVGVPAPDRLSADWRLLSQLVSGGATELPPAVVGADDPHRLMYTSGTTSHPKGVVLTFGNLMAKNASHAVEFGFTGADVGLVAGPMYHVGTLDATVTSMFHVGGSMVVQRRFDAAMASADIERHGVTNLWLAPAMIRMVLEAEAREPRDLSSLRLIVTGGEKSPDQLVDAFEARLPDVWFADGYGLTETVSADVILPRVALRTKRGSAGRPLLYVDLEVHDAEGGQVPPGSPGEIVLRGPKVFAGYWRDSAATEAAQRDGWFHTGDVGILDEDGYLYVVDRLKDMIRSGGENIATPEVERVVLEHPAVAECAVIGSPDPRWGEVPVAFVALRAGCEATPESIVGHCVERLAKYKVPRSVVIVDELPRNPSGKLLKRELRDRLSDSSELPPVPALQETP